MQQEAFGSFDEYFIIFSLNLFVVVDKIHVQNVDNNQIFIVVIINSVINKSTAAKQLFSPWT